MQIPEFAYRPDVTARFPNLVGGVLHADGIANGPTPAALASAFDAEQAEVRARIGATPLSELPSLSAWRQVFRAFGTDPTAYRSAGEALLRRLTKQGSLPSINALVDLGNLVSIRYALPVAVFDLRAIDTGLRVRFATGEEAFTDLGSGEVQAPGAGEVVFVDGAGVAHARRWCWRQSAQSASSPETTEVLVTVEGHHDRAVADVTAALSDLEALLRTHVGPGIRASAVLHAANGWSASGAASA